MAETQTKNLWDVIEDKLNALGVGLEELVGGEGLGSKVKVVCVAPDLKDSVDEMSKSQREHVTMVRVDEETRDRLDAWVATGAVKSRSEAAALFIREGLQVRQAELEQLEGALDDLKQAKERLRDKAREVFGGKSEDDA